MKQQCRTLPQLCTDSTLNAGLKAVIKGQSDFATVVMNATAALSSNENEGITEISQAIAEYHGRGATLQREAQQNEKKRI